MLGINMEKTNDNFVKRPELYTTTNFRAARAILNKTIAELAKEIGCSQNAISNLEKFVQFSPTTIYTLH